MGEHWERFLQMNQFCFNKDQLQCNNCNQLLSAPIYQTADMGNICHTCKGNNMIDAIRNHSLENALTNASFPCKYAANGCDESLASANILIHQLTCHYAPMRCPICKNGEFTNENDMIAHCEDIHGLEHESVQRQIYTVELAEYSESEGIRNTIRKVTLNNNEFIIKVTQMQWNALQVVVCYPNGLKLGQKLSIRIKTDNQEILTHAKMVESWNMMTSTDNDHVTTIHLTEMQKTPHGTTCKLFLDLLFNNKSTFYELQDVENFRKDIQCPICFNYFTEQIFKCRLGHNVCQSCKNHITTCPICREEMENTRDIRMENILPQITMFCINKSFGCLYESDLRILKQHELECRYHQYTCHINNCTHEANQWELIKHYQEKHPMYLNGAIFELDLNKQVELSLVYKNNIFLLESSLEGNTYVWKVSLVNSTSCEWQYMYSIQVINSADKRLQFSTVSGSKLTVDFNLIKSFCNLDKTLKMKCFITQLVVDSPGES